MFDIIFKKIFSFCMNKEYNIYPSSSHNFETKKSIKEKKITLKPELQILSIQENILKHTEQLTYFLYIEKKFLFLFFFFSKCLHSIYSLNGNKLN